MSSVFITGSADGLGLMAAQLLVADGHAVTLHARNDARAKAARAALPSAKDVVVGDVTTLAGMREVAARAAGPFDAVIHNVAIGYREPRRVETEDRIERLFAINVVAPYVLTALMPRPRRLVYLSSGMHRGGETDVRDPEWKQRDWNGSQAYANSKFYDVVLAFAVARLWPSVLSNALEPGWVPTKMGGAGAPDNLELGPVTQAWLAVSEDRAATVTASYFYHQKPRDVNAAARDPELQDALLAYCAKVSGITLPR
ncbi:MAG TPA: SDR family NAD(P)-dependent oxidoreductase [Polyangiaceae bacterium]|jgi:NAD(P)-dependent dehydrogenase (short-subunit alcohol dehydrogenase family)|nr:SDR family NAD(P)-dependent oxidoreductase [Polyangiaceae bacterium]